MFLDEMTADKTRWKRVQFNRETLEAYKSNAYVKFGESLFMDRFLAQADPQKKARSKEIERKLRSCRERLSELTKGTVSAEGWQMRRESLNLIRCSGNPV